MFFWRIEKLIITFAEKIWEQLKWLPVIADYRAQKWNISATGFIVEKKERMLSSAPQK